MSLKDKLVSYISFICQLSRFLMMLVVNLGIFQGRLGDTVIAWTLSLIVALAIEYGCYWSLERLNAQISGQVGEIERLIKK